MTPPFNVHSSHIGVHSVNIVTNVHPEQYMPLQMTTHPVHRPPILVEVIGSVVTAQCVGGMTGEGWTIKICCCTVPDCQ